MVRAGQGTWLRLVGRMKTFVLLILALVSGFFSEQMAFAANAPRLYVPPIPQDLQSVDLYLLTAGVGDEIANRFGHTGIRILDRHTGSDVVFNWGKFHFDDPGFAWKFFRGSLVYTMGVRTFQNDLGIYAETGRRLVMDRLNLTAQQKLHLIQKIRFRALPENRDFQYQYWFKNCATIPRDDLDEVLHGQIASRFGSQLAGRVFRDYVRGNLAHVPFVVPLLDTLMNGNIDRPINRWEDMFLPTRLRETLREMPAVDDDGSVLDGSRLLVDEQVLVDVPENYTPALPDYALLAAPVWLALLGATLAWWVAGAQRDEQRALVWGKLACKALGLGGIYWGLLAGLVGSTLVLNWAFSGHPDGWANANLLFLWPVDFCLIPVGWRLFQSGASRKDRWPWPGAARHFVMLKAFGIALLLTGHVTHLIKQDVTRVALVFGGAALLLCGAIWRIGITSDASFRKRAPVTRDDVLPRPSPPSAEAGARPADLGS